ncbi:DUF6251 family protein [Streptomyces meridianus]|uniref:DUF6251 family protein n=1 Tax=Streptomyces meridianus TaxID=2938945 RepID=A0ABT0XD69_9ACTN|nr:DUF6251 family protein [Streptomyces meridianus]MCM2580466.1 DUF6251 family protein [Streptomyces meridianus]
MTEYLPVPHQHSADCGCYRPEYLPAAPQPPQIVHQHIHQAPPDRTLQRLALGAGMGGGAVAAGVYFGPLLVGALSAIAINLALVAFVVVAVAWGLSTAVKSIGGSDGKAAAENLSKARKRR